MASGATHNKGVILLAVPVGLIALGVGAAPVNVTASVAGTLAGIVLSPDLDVSHRTESEYFIFRHLGPILGSIWFFFWWPYAKAVPHRHWLSHMPLVGTAGRLVYLYFVPALLIWALSGFPAPEGELLPMTLINAPWFQWAVGGLMAADTLHYVMDISPFFKQRSSHRRFGRRRMRW